MAKYIDTEMRITIGLRIKYARKLKKIKQADFAEMIGVTQSNLSSYERGNTPSIEKLIKIANALEVQLDWLCNNITPKEKEEQICRFQEDIDDLIKLRSAYNIIIDNYIDNYKKEE